MARKEISLEFFTAQDIDRLISWVSNERDLLQFAGPIFQFPLTREQLEDYLNDKNRYVFNIVQNPTNKVIGHCEAFTTDKNSVKLCRILIADQSYRGKGFGFSATRELMEWCFTNLKVKSFELNVYDFNIAAIKCYEKLGFLKTQEVQIMEFKGEIWKSVRMILPASPIIQSIR